MNKVISTIKANPIGAIVGGVALFYAAKKFGGVSKKLALGAIAVVGVFAGAKAQSVIISKKGAPTAATVKK
jgi:hypothetical protein